MRVQRLGLAVAVLLSFGCTPSLAAEGPTIAGPIGGTDIRSAFLPPPGEVYGYSEASNGELGFYIVSDGSKCPWRVKVRPPCFNIYQAFPELIRGALLADAIAIIGGLNVIAGELDR